MKNPYFKLLIGFLLIFLVYIGILVLGILGNNNFSKIKIEETSTPKISDKLAQQKLNTVLAKKYPYKILDKCRNFTNGVNILNCQNTAFFAQTKKDKKPTCSKIINDPIRKEHCEILNITNQAIQEKNVQICELIKPYTTRAKKDQNLVNLFLDLYNDCVKKTEKKAVIGMIDSMQYKISNPVIKWCNKQNSLFETTAQCLKTIKPIDFSIHNSVESYCKKQFSKPTDFTICTQYLHYIQFSAQSANQNKMMFPCNIFSKKNIISECNNYYKTKLNPSSYRLFQSF